MKIKMTKQDLDKCIDAFESLHQEILKEGSSIVGIYEFAKQTDTASTALSWFNKHHEDLVSIDFMVQFMTVFGNNAEEAKVGDFYTLTRVCSAIPMSINLDAKGIILELSRLRLANLKKLRRLTFISTNIKK